MNSLMENHKLILLKKIGANYEVVNKCTLSLKLFKVNSNN